MEFLDWIRNTAWLEDYRDVRELNLDARYPWFTYLHAESKMILCHRVVVIRYTWCNHWAHHHTNVRACVCLQILLKTGRQKIFEVTVHVQHSHSLFGIGIRCLRTGRRWRKDAFTRGNKCLSWKVRALPIQIGIIVSKCSLGIISYHLVGTDRKNIFWATHINSTVTSRQRIVQRRYSPGEPRLL